MYWRHFVCVFFSAISMWHLQAAKVLAEVVVTDLEKSVVVDFDRTLSGVHRGPFLGCGLSPAPGGGELDSTAFALHGWEPHDFPLGGIDSDHQLVQGTSPGGVRRPGIYAWNRGGDRALGWQLPARDRRPKCITLCVRNGSFQAMRAWRIEYELLARNDRPGSSSVELSYSTDGARFTPLPSSLQLLAAGQDALPSWEVVARKVEFPAKVEPDGRLYLRWTLSATADGEPDEIGLDNIRIQAARRLRASDVTGRETLVIASVGALAVLLILVHGIVQRPSRGW